MKNNENKYDRLKNLRQKVEKTKGFSFKAEPELVKKHLQSEVNEEQLSDIEVKIEDELDLNVSDEEIREQIETVKANLTKKFKRDPNNYEIHRELSRLAFRIDDIIDYKELLWDPKAKACNDKTGFFTKQLARTMLGRLKTFEIIKLKAGSGPSLIFINGFLSEGEKEGQDWIEAVKNSKYKNNPCYLINWDASSLGKIVADVFSIEALKSACTLTIMNSAIGAGVGLSFAIMSPAALLMPVVTTAIAGGATILSGPLEHWYTALHKTKKVADMLSYILQCTNNEEGFILMGHSLGARIIYCLLNNLQPHKNVLIKEAYLLGGAVKNNEWGNARKAVSENVFNCYSEKDRVLQLLYKPSTLTFFTSAPVGLKVIENVNNISDINAYKEAGVAGHTEHKENFHKILATL